MPNEIEGVAPDSLEAQAIAELQKEGNVIGEHQPVPDDGEVREQVVEPVAPKVEPKEETPQAPEDKAPRTPTMVEAWKLKVAEDQKESATKQVTELQAKIEELSKQTRPITEAQKEDITDDIKQIAEDSGVDAYFLEKFANTILKKAEAKFKPDESVTRTVKELAEQRELLKQEQIFDGEFAKDIASVKEQYGLSDEALSKVKSQLKDLAFSETYAKVPLAKIFKAEFDSFGLKEAKRSSEGKGVKIRTNEVVDFDNLSEDQFNNLSPEQIEAFASRNSSGWHIPK